MHKKQINIYPKKGFKCSISRQCYINKKKFVFLSINKCCDRKVGCDEDFEDLWRLQGGPHSTPVSNDGLTCAMIITFCGIWES